MPADTTRPPAVQASYMKDLFSALEKHGHLEAVGREDPGLVREVASASRASWLPVELNLRMVEAIAAVCGEERGLEILADCIYGQFDSPLWRSFLGGALRLLGKDPGSLGRWIPKAIQLLFRGCGEWSVERGGDAELSVSVRKLPTPLDRHRLWLQSLAVGFTPLFTLCGVSGRSELVVHDPDESRARYRLTWKDSGAPSGATAARR